MRNLKKVLALALAVVMLVGMMVVGAGAATYSDVSAADNAVAIEVVSAIKAITGNNGKFNPNGKLTRADGAVIAARVALGKDVADKLVGATGVYSDVSAKAYYSGAIAWATNEGYLSGDGSGAFRPNGSLYGVHFAKMLLGVIGYNAEIEGFTGKDYVQKITLIAAQAGLLNGLESVELNGKITRGQAAVMAYNALTAEMVGYTGGSNITIGDVTITQGAVRGEKGQTLAADKYGIAQFTTTWAKDAPATTYWATIDALGNEVAPIANTTTSAAANIILTGAKQNLSTTTLKNYTFVDCTVSVNGETGSTFSGAQGDLATDFAALEALTGQGVTVKLYTNNKVIYDVEVLSETLVTVNTVGYNKAQDVYTFTFTKVAGGASAVNNVTYVADTPNTIYNALVEMELEAGDFLLVSTNNKTITAVSEPATVAGKTTKIDANGAYVVVGGETVKNNKNAAMGNAVVNTTTPSQTVFCDSEGNALYIMNTPAAGGTPVTTPNFVYVLENWVEQDDRLGNVTYIQYVDLDGTVKEARVGALGGLTPATAGTAQEGNKAQLFTINATTGLMELANLTIGIAPAPVIGAKDMNTTLTGKELKIDTNYYVSSDVKTVYINELNLSKDLSDTVVEVVDGLPVFDSNTVFTYVLSKDADGNSVISHIFVEGTPDVEPETADGLIYVGATINAGAVKYTELAADGKSTLNGVEVYIDGVKSELLLTGATITNTVAPGFYTYSVDAETGAATLYAYTGTNVEKHLTETITAIDYVNGKYYMTSTNIATEYDATEAVVYYVADPDYSVTSVAELAQCKADGDTIQLAVVAVGGNTDAVKVIYVINYAPAGI